MSKPGSRKNSNIESLPETSAAKLNSAELSSVESKMRLRAWLKILKTSSFIEKIIRERLRDKHATTLPRFDVMSALSRVRGGMKMSELSGVLKVSNGNVTGIIDRLVADGHVIRVAVKGDRRANLVKLTAPGRRQFDHYAVEHEAWVNEILNDLGANDIDALITLLDVVTAEEEGA